MALIMKNMLISVVLMAIGYLLGLEIGMLYLTGLPVILTIIWLKPRH